MRQTVQLVRLRQVREKVLGRYGTKIVSPMTLYQLVKPLLHESAEERLVVVCLDAINQPTHVTVASIGAVNTTRTHPREIFRLAMITQAVAIVLAHNHPSGSLEISPEDKEFTQGIVKVGDFHGIELYDHLIVGHDAFTSMREAGLI